MITHARARSHSQKKVPIIVIHSLKTSRLVVVEQLVPGLHHSPSLHALHPFSGGGDRWGGGGVTLAFFFFKQSLEVRTMAHTHTHGTVHNITPHPTTCVCVFFSSSSPRPFMLRAASSPCACVCLCVCVFSLPLKSHRVILYCVLRSDTTQHTKIAAKPTDEWLDASLRSRQNKEEVLPGSGGGGGGGLVGRVVCNVRHPPRTAFRDLVFRSHGALAGLEPLTHTHTPHSHGSHTPAP